ncbi:hypothetical protein BDZ94DRAFT_1269741 [Collybia nuda]|uniref:Uncharacterized protein n=1 Tax=Collybia nuda TaxID=64659 RepID=A0A9P5Y040_9AGAR|nr:hypothetical protein BDZ94DRAFT_1269741 [Collybia nuda]
MPAGRDVDYRLQGYDVEFLDLEVEGLQPTQQTEENKPVGGNSGPHLDDQVVQSHQPSDHLSSHSSLSHRDTRRTSALPPTLLGRSSPLRTYTLMIISFLCGTILAIGHHLFYEGLDGRHVPERDQFIIAGHHISSQQSAIFGGTALVFFAKFCFSFSLGHVFNQRLWYTMHRKWIKVKGLDAMFKVPGDPLGFFSLEMLTKAKTVAGVAGVMWCLSIAFIPIPGSLSVKSVPVTTLNRVSVPTVNITDPAVNFGSTNTLGAYNSPSTFAQAVASRTLTGGQVPAWNSPCGTNCNYNLTFIGPAFQCSSPSSVNIPAVTPKWIANQTKGADIDVLTISYISDSAAITTSTTNCSSYRSTYSIGVSFKDGVFDIRVHNVEHHEPFGTTEPLQRWGVNGAPGAFNPRGLGSIAGIKDAVVKAVSGSVFYDIQVGLILQDTLILYSTLASYGANETTRYSSGQSSTAVSFGPDVPRMVEELLANTTMALMASSIWTTSTEAIVTFNVNVFSYDMRVLWAGYGASIGVTVVLIIFGAAAVRANGGGGDRTFTLIGATTRDPSLDEVFGQTLKDKQGASSRLEKKLKYDSVDADDGPRMTFHVP